MQNKNAAFAEVARAIEECGGWLRFDKYLHIVQHGANGYYGGGKVQFGADFVTAPMLSPLFGGALSGQVAQIAQACGGGVLEFGAGDGALAKQILRAPDCQTLRYEIIETSPKLRELQQKNLAAFNNVAWRDELPQTFNGVIVANEVLDCLPFRLLQLCSGEWRERGVILQNGALAFGIRPLDDEGKQHAATLPHNLPDGYQTEICPQMAEFVRNVAEVIVSGAALFLDYGFGAGEYYHPQRSGGTMMCHRANKTDDNPLIAAGEKDITAHINFTALANAAIDGGTQFLGYTNQASFLINCGITDLLADNLKIGDLPYAKLSAGVNKLLSPSEMGELFKAAAFGKNTPPLIAFRNNNQTMRL